MAFGCSDDLLRGMGAVANKHGAGISGHACSSREPTVQAHLKFGMGDVARLAGELFRDEGLRLAVVAPARYARGLERRLRLPA